MKIVKALASLFILYHLTAMFVLPLGTSRLTTVLGPYVSGYASTFGLNTSWQFFSPGPSPIFFLEYTFDSAAPGAAGNDKTRDSEAVTSEVLQYPEPKKLYTFDDAKNRRLFGMRFFALEPDRLESYFVPFLCRLHKAAVAVDIKQVFEKVPSLENLDENSKLREQTEKSNIKRQNFRCPMVSAQGASL
jgi:hypothetical protein